MTYAKTSQAVMDDSITTQQVIKGDCLEVLSDFPDECIDLIYLDPPFFSGTTFDIVWSNGAELAAYTDSKMYWSEQPVDVSKVEEDVQALFDAGVITDKKRAVMKILAKRQGRISSGGMEGYLDYMRPRLKEIRRVLKKTGSIYLHCDHHASAHLRIMMDEIFGTKNFQNEIVWSYRTGGATKKRWSRKHDTILFYTKSGTYTFNLQKEKAYTKAKGRKAGIIDYGAGTAEFFEDEQGVYNWVFARDVWDIPYINSQAKERLGYPTQKPETLIERIILASSNEGDIVLDPFVGGGTTLVTAERLGRKWIGIDVSPTACNMCVKNFERYGLDGDKVKVVNFVPKIENQIEDTVSRLKKMDWSEFEQWVREQLGFKWTDKCRRLGIDGIKPDEFLEVKHWKKPVGQATVDRLAGKMRRGGVKKGIIVAETFTSGVFRASASFKEKGIDIEIRFVRDILPAISSRHDVMIVQEELLAKEEGIS